MPKIKRSDALAPRIVIVRVLFYLNTFVWFCLGTYLVFDMLQQKNGFSAVLVGFFLYINAGAMFVSGKYIGQRENWAYYFGFFVLIANALVTRIGQFGFFDLLALFFDITIFCALLSIDRAYLKK